MTRIRLLIVALLVAALAAAAALAILPTSAEQAPRRPKRAHERPPRMPAAQVLSKMPPATRAVVAAHNNPVWLGPRFAGVPARLDPRLNDVSGVVYYDDRARLVAGIGPPQPRALPIGKAAKVSTPVGPGLLSADGTQLEVKLADHVWVVLFTRADVDALAAARQFERLPVRPHVRPVPPMPKPVLPKPTPGSRP